MLQALTISTPVLARAAPGNLELIRHQRTGLLYNSADECVYLAKTYLHGTLLCRIFCSHARLLLSADVCSCPIAIPKPRSCMLADLEKRQKLIESGKQYAERYHSALTEFRVLGQALALLRAA